MFQSYIEDALGDRVWMDLKSCKKLTDNIVTLFNTRSIGGEESSEPDNTQQDESMETAENDLSKLINSIPIQPRYDKLVIDHVTLGQMGSDTTVILVKCNSVVIQYGYHRDGTLLH